MRKDSPPKKRTSISPSTVAKWEKLTWDELDGWADSRSVERGKAYQRQGRVQGLCISPTGVLLAWMQGSERYATRVELDDSFASIGSSCSCPIGVNQATMNRCGL